MNHLAHRILLCILLLGPIAAFGRTTDLPLWAAKAVAEGAKETTPLRAAAWILLDRTSLFYKGKGQIQIQRQKVVRVLSREGMDHAVFNLFGDEGPSYRVLDVQGWNSPPKGNVNKLNHNSAFQLDPDANQVLTSQIKTVIALPEVVPGSIVAFESMEVITPPQGPILTEWVGQRDPILRWELKVDSEWALTNNIRAVFKPWNLEKWTREMELVPERTLTLHHIPGVRSPETAAPGSFEYKPIVSIRFFDPFHPLAFEGSGKQLGKSTYEQMNFTEPPPTELPVFEGDPLYRFTPPPCRLNS